MKKRKRRKVILLVIFVAVIMYCCSPYRDGWECREFLWRMKLEEPDCLKLRGVGLHHGSKEFLLWYEVPGGLEDHVVEILSTKTRIEELLAETGEVPEEYDIWIQFAYLGDVISFSNTATDFMVEETGGPKFGGHHLFEVHVMTKCSLSDLSVLENVKYLILKHGISTDDISGLKNMKELIYICMSGNPYKVTPDMTFTEEKQQAVKEMYPDCYISCFPVDSY